MTVLHYPTVRVSQIEPTPAAQVAVIYDRAGKDYAAYADGDLSQLFSFEGIHGYADRQIWHVLDRKLTDLRACGAASVRILDAGCGPGTWLRRMTVRARELGFSRITARGFDISRSQIDQARSLAADFSASSEVHLTFDVSDLTEPLSETDSAVDIALCLYSVLSHLPVGRLPDVSRELSRVTAGHLIVSARAIGSVPSGFVYPIESIRHLRHDHDRDQCEIELQDRSRARFSMHLFTAAELKECFARDFYVEDVTGLDLFHTRFSPDSRWNPSSLRAEQSLCDELAQLEKIYATKPEFVDRATHIMLVAATPSAKHRNAG